MATEEREPDDTDRAAEDAAAAPYSRVVDAILSTMEAEPPKVLARLQDLLRRDCPPSPEELTEAMAQPEPSADPNPEAQLSAD